MSYGGELLVHAETLSAASQNVASAHNELNTKLHDLRTLLQPLTQTWTGQAAADYQERQRQWDQAQADLNEVLQFSMAMDLGP
jgi:early secretory antigenic target protein ESAT-6